MFQGSFELNFSTWGWFVCCMFESFVCYKVFCLSIDVNWVALVADVNVGDIVNSVFCVLWFWCLI